LANAAIAASRLANEDKCEYRYPATSRMVKMTAHTSAGKRAAMSLWFVMASDHSWLATNCEGFCTVSGGKMFRLPVDIRREIERLAAKEGVSRSEMFRMLLEQAMKRRPR
jgi:hypothetical protein